MAQNKKSPLRKLIQKTGLDVHRFRPEPNRLKWLAERNIQTVLDVGANTGQFAAEVRDALPKAHIYSFEPLKDCYAQLVKNTLKDPQNTDQNFTAFNFALGEANEDVVIHHSDYSPSSSILDMADEHKKLFPHTKESKNESILVRRLDDVKEVAPEKLIKNILLKIDTQGFEDKVLAGAQNFLKHVDCLIVEASFVELYKDQPLFADIYKLLTNAGYIYRGSIHQKLNPKNGEVLFEDAVFVR